MSVSPCRDAIVKASAPCFRFLPFPDRPEADRLLVIVRLSHALVVFRVLLILGAGAQPPPPRLPAKVGVLLSIRPAATYIEMILNMPSLPWFGDED